MWWKNLLIYVLILSHAFCNEDAIEDLNRIESPLFISLGSHCGVAGGFGIYRKTAFPFDWLLTTNHERFLAILEEDFQFFLDDRYFIRNSNFPTFVEHVHYAIQFRHEWLFPDNNLSTERYEQQIGMMKSKYTRRIERFRRIRNYQGKVFFFRAPYNRYYGLGQVYTPALGVVNSNSFLDEETQVKISFEQALALKRTLDQYFINTNFNLIIINYIEESTPSIEGIEGVYEFKIRAHPQYHIEDYERIFQVIQNIQ